MIITMANDLDDDDDDDDEVWNRAEEASSGWSVGSWT